MGATVLTFTDAAVMVQARCWALNVRAPWVSRNGRS